MVSADPVAVVAPLVRRWARHRGSLIMVLYELQKRYGYVPRDLALAVARAMNVPLARIYEVLTFYHYFRLRPPGRTVVSVCDGTACHLLGARGVMDAVGRSLQLSPGDVSHDAMRQLNVVRCLGCCALAPMMTIDGRVRGPVQASRVAALLDEAGAAVDPSSRTTSR